MVTSLLAAVKHRPNSPSLIPAARRSPSPTAAWYLSSVHPVHDRVLAYIDDPAGGSFEALAVEVFAHQFEAIEPYRQYCRAREVTPRRVRHWTAIPAGSHPGLQAGRTLLRAATEDVSFDRHERGPAPALPSSDARPASLRALGRGRNARLPVPRPATGTARLAHPAGRPGARIPLWRRWWPGRSSTLPTRASAFVITATGLDTDRLIEVLRDSERDGQPCCILATTGAPIRLLDLARERALTFRLPHGSRLMDTGGDKGAPRRVSRAGLLHACWNTFGIPGYFCVNEYGMAELSSQFYDNVTRKPLRGSLRPKVQGGPAVDSHPGGRPGLAQAGCCRGRRGSSATSTWPTPAPPWRCSRKMSGVPSGRASNCSDVRRAPRPGVAR